MAKPFITIIGLGATGSSIGKALRKEPGDFEVVGHDKKSAAEGDNRRAGAVDRSEWNLHRAVEGASLVVLAIPLPEVDDTLRLIEEDIAENTLVLVFSTLLQPVLTSARQFLPRHRRVVAAHIVPRIGSSAADPLAGSTLCIAAPVDAEANALELASDFADRVGATPHFIDGPEHDGIIALVEQTPQLLGAMLLDTATASAGWQESRRIAGSRFAQATDIGGNAQHVAATWLQNRENVLLRIDQLQRELERWRALLLSDEDEGKAHPLYAAIEGLFAERDTWASQAESQNWDQEPQATSTPATSGMLRQLFLGNLGRRKPPATTQ